MVGYLPGLDTMPPPAPSSADPENPRPLATVEQPGREERYCRYAICVVLCCVLAVPVAALFVWIFNMPLCPYYSVAVDSVSGLAGVQAGLALDPAFNLTLRVASLSRHDDACVEPGTYVEVAYRCVTLATSATTDRRLCAGPRKAAEQQLIARGSGVRLPGTVLDSFATDMRQGVLAFQVTIRQSGGDYADDMLVASCGGRRVGAAAADLGNRCNAWHLCDD